MPLEHFNDLLATARRQPEPQRLLLVFVSAELPVDASESERAAFERGEGGALAPVVCVGKRPEEIESFEALSRESEATGVQWQLLFVTTMSGRGGHPPNSDEDVQPMRLMVEQIRAGRIAHFLAVRRDGALVELART